MCSSYIHTCHLCLFLFFFNDTATTEIYTLSLHDALPIFSRSTSWTTASRYSSPPSLRHSSVRRSTALAWAFDYLLRDPSRSEEHTSELQSRLHLVCRLLLEKKKQQHCQKCRHRCQVCMTY